MLKKKYYYPTDKYFFITVQPNSSSFGSTVPNGTDKYLKGSSLSISATPNTGYIFSRWSDNDTNASRTVTVVEDKTYTAIFTLPNYTVTYNGNGNTGGSVPTDSHSPYSSGSEVEVLGNTGNLVKTGHTFLGWTMDQGGSGTLYNAGDTFTISEDTTLYAKWLQLLYTATVISTSLCTMTIDGVTDGSKQLSSGANVSSYITKTVALGYSVSKYLIHPDVGSDYEVTGTITMPSCNITITPIGAAQLTAKGYPGSEYMLQLFDNIGIGVYDPSTQQISSTYLLPSQILHSSTLLTYLCLWGFASQDYIEYEMDYWFPYTYFAASSTYYWNSGYASPLYPTIGTTVTVVFGINPNDSTYEEYGFEIEESISPSQVLHTIVLGTVGTMAPRGGGSNSLPCVYYTFTVNYPTNVKCLVKLKS